MKNLAIRKKTGQNLSSCSLFPDKMTHVYMLLNIFIKNTESHLNYFQLMQLHMNFFLLFDTGKNKNARPKRIST